jgi:hypothetical protein
VAFPAENRSPVHPLQRELKYVFPNLRAGWLREWLGVRCRPDGEFAAGRISSIYFDTWSESLLDEKVNSDYQKTKVRLRWYGDWATGAPGGAVFLEVKQRFGSTRRKHRQRLAWAAADLEGLALEDARLLEVNRMVGEAGFRFEGPLRPAICLAYRRSRYLEAATGTRICLDHDICPVRIHAGLGGVVRGQPLAEGVFEVKGVVERLPETLAPLIALGCRRESFSKFQRCMDQRVPAAIDPSNRRAMP